MSDRERRVTDTIPRLDKVEYLFDTLVRIGEGQSLDQLRLNLIDMRRGMDRETRRDLRPERVLRRKALDNPSPQVFWSNAREAVRELIRLGMVQRARFPNTFEEFNQMRESKFELTEEGKQFIALGEESVWKFRDTFFCAMDASHPYLRNLRQVLADHDLFIPRVARADIPGDVGDWCYAPPEPLDDFAQKVASEITAATQRPASGDDILQVLRPSLKKTWSLHPPKGDNKTLTRWVVKMMNEQLTYAVAVTNNIAIDSIAFRHAVSLLSDFHVCWETRSLTDRDGWTIWLTADGQLPNLTKLATSGESCARQALTGEPWIRRISLADDVILQETIETILSNPRSSGFSLIHEVRAKVCYRLRIHGWVFNSALRKAVSKEITLEEYDLHIDAGGGDKLPASEDPFTFNGKPFYLITVLKRSTT